VTNRPPARARHNSALHEYAPDHDGHYLLAEKEIQEPNYIDRVLIGSITFARQAGGN
jgi:hypothetical protein